MTYGLPVRRAHDPVVEMTEKYFRDLTAAAAPGKYLVNVIPVLKHVPDWMPGAAFKKAAQEIREKMYQTIELPYEGTLKIMVCLTSCCLRVLSNEVGQNDGTVPEAFVSESLERYKERSDFALRETDIKHVAAQIFAGAWWGYFL